VGVLQPSLLQPLIEKGALWWAGGVALASRAMARRLLILLVDDKPMTSLAHGITEAKSTVVGLI